MMKKLYSNDTKYPALNSPSLPRGDTAATPEQQDTQQMLVGHVASLAVRVEELKQKGAASITGDLTHWLSAQFVAAATKAEASAEGGCIDLKILHALGASIVHLRVGDQNAERLRIIRSRLDFDIRKFQHNQLEEFKKWSQNEKVKKVEMTDEQYAQNIQLLGKELFGEDWDD
jgi:hypothetical protein